MIRRRCARSFVIALALVGGCAHRTAPVAPTAAVPAGPLDAATAHRIESVERMLPAVAAVRGLAVTSRPRIDLLDDDTFRTVCLADTRRYGQDMQAIQKDCSGRLGYYDSVRDRMVLRSSRIANLSAFDRSEALSHELEHWLVAHSLPALPERGDHEDILASRALAEGDAVITSVAYLLSLGGVRLAGYIQRVLAAWWVSCRRRRVPAAAEVDGRDPARRSVPRARATACDRHLAAAATGVHGRVA